MKWTSSKELTVWGYLNTASQLMHTAHRMIFDALWEANEIDDDNPDDVDLTVVSKPLEKLMNDAEKLTKDIERETKYFSPLTE